MLEVEHGWLHYVDCHLIHICCLNIEKQFLVCSYFQFLLTAQYFPEEIVFLSLSLSQHEYFRNFNDTKMTGCNSSVFFPMFQIWLKTLMKLQKEKETRALWSSYTLDVFVSVFHTWLQYERDWVNLQMISLQCVKEYSAPISHSFLCRNKFNNLFSV